VYDALPLALEFEELRLVYRELRTELETLGLLLGDALEEFRMPDFVYTGFFPLRK